MSQPDQQELIRSLLKPDPYSHSTEGLELIETHISWVILCGPYAYKVKKAVNLGFLDFSSLDKRRFYCEEELRLNGRLAPDIYLQVIAISGTSDAPELSGIGEPIEYAVKMARFPQTALLNHMLKQGELLSHHMEEIATVISKFHQNIEVASKNVEFGSPENISLPVQQNFDQIQQYPHDPNTNETLTNIQHWSEQEFSEKKVELLQRKRDGFIRECHGDLHLGNMAMINNTPTLFDGIEFNPELRWIDVLSDAAFLFMDLEDHNRSDHAYRFLNSYLENTGDYEGLILFRYYLAYRAMVRAKVACIRMQQAENNVFEKENEEFNNYLSLAKKYINPTAPRLFITHGLSASGKSTIANQLADKIPAIRIRSDRERQRLFRESNLKEESQNNDAQEINAGIYTLDASKKTYQRLHHLTEKTLTSGFSVIVDAAFLDRQQREPFEKLSKQLNVSFTILDFHASEKILRERILKRQTEKNDISEAGLAVLEHQLGNYTGIALAEMAKTISINTECKVDMEALAKDLT